MNNLRSVAVATLGCKVNSYDTEAMLELLKAKGYEIKEFGEFADVYIINTCTVTNVADKKSRQLIRRAKAANPDGIVVVAGCYAQVAPGEIEGMEGVNLILGTVDRAKIVEELEQYSKEQGTVNKVADIKESKAFETLDPSAQNRTRAFYKIQEGCNQFCSYCIIPYARGNVRSRSPEEVVEGIKKLAENGYKEVVLVGIHVASYGKDLEDIDLVSLLYKIHEISGLNRIRLSSVDPRLITEEFVEHISRLPKICDHFHLSLQSGSDRILKLMNRKYTAADYAKSVDLLRKAYPKLSLTTDIIVGFPSETDLDFKETYDFVKKLSLTKVHVFPYSPKKGTPAATFEEQIPKNIKDERCNKLIKLSNRLADDFMGTFVGKVVEVLFESSVGSSVDSSEENAIYEGFSTNYITVRAESDTDVVNSVLPVRITRIEDGYAFGEILSVLKLSDLF